MSHKGPFTAELPGKSVPHVTVYHEDEQASDPGRGRRKGREGEGGKRGGGDPELTAPFTAELPGTSAAYVTDIVHPRGSRPGSPNAPT